jgi:cytoskeletal protein RodZ
MVFKFLNKGKKSEFFLEAPPLSHEADPAAKLADVKKAAEAKVSELKETVAKVIDAVEEKTAQPEPTKATKAKKGKKTKVEPETTSSPAASVKVESSKAKPAAEAPKTFATDFLMPSNTPRRRPGPSLKMFQDMAKDMNSRK